jgi:hypothetical protein
MNRRHERSPGAARLLALCALLLGLFLMHGMPTAAAEGCHGDRAAMTALAAHADGMPHPAGAQAATDAAGPARSSGALCVSTPGRGNPVLPASALFAVIPAVAAARLWSGRIEGAFSGRRRGPPQAGRTLLHQVCIART